MSNPTPHEDDVKLAENILKAFMEVPWRGMSKQQIVELVSKQVAIALNPLRTENEALREMHKVEMRWRMVLQSKLTAVSEVIEKCERAVNGLLYGGDDDIQGLEALAAIKSWKDKNGKDFTPPVAG